MVKIDKKFAALMICALVFAYSQGGNLPYAVFYGFLLSFLLGVLYVIKMKNGIYMKTEMDRNLYFCGEQGEYKLIIENLTLLPIPFLIIKNRALADLNLKYKGQSINLNIDEKKIIKGKVNFKVRGIYNFGDNDLNISDLFSIFKIRKYYNSHEEIKVYPKITDIKGIEVNGYNLIRNIVNFKGTLEDISAVKDIRKYNTGDSLKRVHWKLSAKYGQLYVKDFDNVSEEKCTLLFNMNEDDYFVENGHIIEEKIVGACVSVINNMQIRDITCDVFINNSSVQRFSIESREDFNTLMEYFLVNKSKGKMEYIKFIYSSLESIHKGSWLGIFTHKADEEFANCIINIMNMGYRVTVIYILENPRDLNYINVIKNSQIDCINFNELII
ncbi:DUF58 domain-containing protein [Clostridium sp. JN-9]|uniref:DUF58 domain-containing protein n=1 Tax=Clostridium sp. JN-9 TaxID=2507159 RepID=UPI000FFE00A8|nr:DUF58 domain-containing protein [Clostridium sp. JN-9]QAT39048.1 DUF58 domain-containing protein [Clostridium sp. JN-9]